MYRKTAVFIVHAIALGAMIVGLLLAAPAFAAGPTTLAGLRSSLDAQMAKAGKRSGAYVVDLGTGRTLFDVRSRTRLVPASLEKLYTTSAALLSLGATPPPVDRRARCRPARRRHLGGRSLPARVWRLHVRLIVIQPSGVRRRRHGARAGPGVESGWDHPDQGLGARRPVVVHRRLRATVLAAVVREAAVRSRLPVRPRRHVHALSPERSAQLRDRRSRPRQPHERSDADPPGAVRRRPAGRAAAARRHQRHRPPRRGPHPAGLACPRDHVLTDGGPAHHADEQAV